MPKKRKQADQVLERSLISIPTASSELERRFYDDFDAIYRYYTDPTGKLELTAKQAEQLARWNWIWGQIVDYHRSTNRDLVVSITNKFGIGEKQAYIDLANTRKFYASMEKVAKDFDKVIMIRKLRDQEARLTKTGKLNVKAELALTKNIALQANVLGLMEPENLTPAPVVVYVEQVYDVSVLGIEPMEPEQLLKMVKALGRKKEEQRQLEYQDVDFEEIKDGNRSDQQRPGTL